MPEIASGGKYVYGWSKVTERGRIVIPEEAADEYGFSEWDKVILMSGSRRSGGFGLTTPRLLGGSPLASILRTLPRLRSFQMPEARTVRMHGRTYCWTTIQEGGYILLPLQTLRQYEIVPGDRLLAVRGSEVALGFAVRGPLVEEAVNHPELETFE